MPVGVLLSDPKRVERRVHHAHVRSFCLCLEQASLRARHAHHVAKAGEDHALFLRDRDAVVHAPHWDDAHRATWAVDQLDVLGEQLVDRVLVDRVRVAAADLHDLVVSARLHQSEDLTRNRTPEIGVAELVHEPHAYLSIWSAVPAWTSRLSPCRTGRTSSISTDCISPVSDL